MAKKKTRTTRKKATKKATKKASGKTTKKTATKSKKKTARKTGGGNVDKFRAAVTKGYTHEGLTLTLGGGMLDGEAVDETHVHVPLKTLNRHGLIAGATGTGKTKSLQVLAGELSEKGVPCLLMDLKGDLSGLAAAGEAKSGILKRHEKIGLPFEERAYGVEFLTLSKEKGARLRATVSEFGPLLLSKILDLSDAQSGILSILFQFCDDKGLLLLDLKDLKKALHFMTNEGKAEVEAEYGRISAASAGTILRKVVALEQQGAKKFFGERSFDVEDLLGFTEDGLGRLSIIRLKDIQSKPQLFSTFMLQLLAEVYEKFPEEGDLEQPKLMIFIDEAHLVFQNAAKELLNQIEMIIKLIRSKGVGIVFITQIPDDVPAPILSQLGFKIQHSLRAFTARDRKAIKKTAENFPESPFYDNAELLTSMGIGEAMVTVLGEKGRPTPLVHTMMRAPASRMGTLKPAEIKEIADASSLAEKYNEEIDRPSAYEILSEKAKEYGEDPADDAPSGGRRKRRSRKAEKSTLEKVMDHTITKQVGRTVARELTRGLLGVFGIKTGRRRKSSFF